VEGPTDKKVITIQDFLAEDARRELEEIQRISLSIISFAMEGISESCEISIWPKSSAMG
jgi:hypothetical protein